METILLVANDEATTDSITIELYDSEGEPITGKMTILNSNGTVVSVYDFSALPTF